MASLAQIIGARVNDNGTAQDTLRSDQLHKLVRNGALGVALGICLEVAQVTHVPDIVIWCPMLFAVWVDWSRNRVS